MSSSDLISFDRKLLAEHGPIAGLDEVGRGALAGPVFVGCLSFPNLQAGHPKMAEVQDSKRLSLRQREELFTYLADLAGLRLALGQADNEEIDRLGINEATELAVSRALRSLLELPDLLVVDRGLPVPTEGPVSSPAVKSLKQGDRKSFHVAGASILAKVARDRYMRLKAADFPEYGWETNVGYGTAEHRDSLKKCGPVNLHRKSYGSWG